MQTLPRKDRLIWLIVRQYIQMGKLSCRMVLINSIKRTKLIITRPRRVQRVTTDITVMMMHLMSCGIGDSIWNHSVAKTAN